MILTDREIELALASKQIQITPPPDKSAYSSTSVDLTLDGRGRIWRELPGVTLNPGDSEYSYRKVEQLQQEVAISNFQLKSQSFLLAWNVRWSSYLGIPGLPRGSRARVR